MTFLRNTVVLLSTFAVSVPLYAQSIDMTHLPTFTCPPISKVLKTESNYWGTRDNNFRNFETSFAVHLDKFLGAQWQGATLGQVSCVYKPHKPGLFFVTLLFNKLTYTPNTGLWKKADKGSLYNCHSNNVTDCRFSTRPKPPKVDIYKVAEQLRGDANPYSNPGF
ncbi:MAG: hypothetical protein COB66_00535 [Coxiella sp. (in: Bacteria)]|nr:MAG: hypothetical protein COB66_00535 [Coxiella sp. (in: g-proteobacteria)]